MNLYEKYGVMLPKISNQIFSNEVCMESKNILFYTGYSPIKWNHTYGSNNALGGSETAIISLSSNFPKEYKVYISGDVEEETVDNITYINMNNLHNLIKTTAFHTIIVSRYLNFYEIYKNFSAYQTFIWGHDIALFPYGTNLSVESILQKWLSKITGCVCQTEWHKNLFISTYPQLNNKITVINNGVNNNMFTEHTRKVNNRFVYTSCTERGLDRLLELWPLITKEIPDAELFISSYNNFPTNSNEVSLKNIIDSYPNVEHMGKLNKLELYELISTAEYWLYPTNFNETSCITAMEMLISEVICLYYPIAGLVDTLGDYGIPVQRGNEIQTILDLTTKNKNEIKKRGKEYAISCSWENRAKKWSKVIFNKKEVEKNNIESISDNNVKYTIKVINLKHRNDRRNNITNIMKQENIQNFEFFEAINGKELQLTDELIKLFERNDFGYKKGVIGCALSHLYLWKQLIHDTSNNFYVILEDDIKLCKNFKHYLDMSCKLFVDQKLEHLALGEYNSDKKFPNGELVLETYKKNLYSEWNVTFAYIISKSAVIKAIEYVNSCSIKCAFDNPQAFGYILNYCALNYKLVSCEILNEHGSDIQSNSSENFFNVLPFNQNPKNLTISFCDWWNTEYCGGIFDFNDNFFTNLLREHSNNYVVKIVNPNENPDILFYSIFGNSHQSYEAKRKIFFSGEPYSQRENADFNITFDENSIKNTRVPLWLCYIDGNNIETFKNRKFDENILKEKNKFCSFIASGAGLANNRKEFVDILNKYKLVDCGGQYLNNIGYTVPIGMNCSGKIEHNKNYKFAMAFESKCYPGYVTEKIFDIFKSNTIPIYWGSSDVVKDFNPKSFINANDFSSFDELVKYIIEVDNNNELYLQFFKQSIFSKEWIDIFSDCNKCFFKNLADKIIGNEDYLFDSFIGNKKEFCYICGPQSIKPLLDDYIHNINKKNKKLELIFIDENVIYDNNCDINNKPAKIICINRIKHKKIFEKFKNCEISILNIDSLFKPCFLFSILDMNILYPNVKIYDYSDTNIRILNKYGITNTELWEYKYDNDEVNYLRKLNISDKIYDFGIIGYDYDKELNTSKRIKYIVEKLRNNGFNVHVASGFNEKRDIELSKCKIIINIHGKHDCSPVENRTFETLRCNRLLYSGFNVLSEIACLNKEFAKKYTNLKFIKYNDFEKITRENIDTFSFGDMEFDKEKLDDFFNEQFKPKNIICEDYVTKKSVNIFNIWHNKLFDKCYEDLDNYSLSKINMFDVNPSYQKIYNKNINYKIIKEYELEIYNNLLQATNYCQTSCLYHVYINGQNKNYDFYYHNHYIGFIQYDMELASNFIYDIEDKINLTDKDIFFYSLIANDKLERNFVCKPYNNSILEKYNSRFGTSHTYESIKNHEKSKYFICLHTFVIPTLIYMKMMNWYCSISDWLHVNYINGLYTESMSEVTEEIFGLFLLLQIIENDNIELEELKLRHNWPNLHNETLFNNYKENINYFSLSTIINNNLTDKNSYHSYIDVYENLFKNKQLTTKNLLEIGIERGGSLKLWNNYFVNAKIYGLDINEPPEILSRYERIITKKFDAYSLDSLNYFIDKNIKFDIIIDDGPHTLESMIFVVEKYTKLLNIDGILIIEDVQAIEWCEHIYNKISPELKEFSYHIDRRHVKGTLDDILFIIENKYVIEEIPQEKNNDLWVFYAFNGHNYKVIEDYINSLREIYNIVYTQDIDFVLSCNPTKISFVMNITDDKIINKYKNTDIELSYLNTEPLSISYNLDLLKNYINKYPYLKIYDYSFSNLQIILQNNMYGELLEYQFYKKENILLKELYLNEQKLYDFGIITYGNTKTNTCENSLFHKKKDVVLDLIDKGYKIHIISGWGIDRDKELAKCKVILNIHSILGINGEVYYSKTFENIRCNRLLDAGFKILSEDSIHCNDIANKYKNNLKFINYNDFKKIEYYDSEDVWGKIVYKDKIKKYCFIHSCNMENVGTYRLDYLVDKLNTTKCIDIIDKIYIINIGIPIENSYGEKYEVINYSNNIALFENPTINFMKKFSEKNDNSNILYIHTKGVRFDPNDSKENDWIDYMLYFLLEQNKLCISILNNGYDTVGCNYNMDIDKTVYRCIGDDPHKNPPHYSGNFWWANTNYIKTLPLLSIENPDRMAPEFWVLKNNPILYNLHSSQVLHYHVTYPRDKYIPLSIIKRTPKNKETDLSNKSLNEILTEITINKVGVEIGGPSSTGVVIYENAIRMDNVIFSKDTVWSKHNDEYNYYYNKKGRVIINDSVNITNITNDCYDFVFSSHSLEHIANPLKAINEWLRIIKNDGFIIIIVPEKSACFDHKRNYSEFSTLLSQYEKNVGEDDLSTLPEILMNHDLSMDPPAGNFQAFAKRSLDNFNNRCLHHYVYNDDLLKTICGYFKCKFIYKETSGLHRWFIMKKV
jgi:GR25 family glycosyltransferase involved in LPS biosynthesis/SAM-dependent methyltransferase